MEWNGMEWAPGTTLGCTSSDVLVMPIATTLGCTSSDVLVISTLGCTSSDVLVISTLGCTSSDVLAMPIVLKISSWHTSTSHKLNCADHAYNVWDEYQAQLS
jgi:hypothetical protein